MRSLWVVIVCLSLMIMFESCTKDEEIIEPPHYDCFGDVLPGFPFLESEVGTISNSEGGIYYTGIFYDNGEFKITYSGNCNVDTSSMLCKNDMGELVKLELELTGTWEYNHTIDIIRVYKEECGFTCDKRLDHSYTQLNGNCNLTIVGSSIPEFVGEIIVGSYSVNCNSSVFLIHIPKTPIIGLLFEGE